MFKSIKIYKNERLNYKSLARNLTEYGYERCSKISEPGDFSMRGGIIDVFPPVFEGPVRVELAGNEVGSIKSYSIISGETLEEHSMVIILPVPGPHPRIKRKKVSIDEKTPLKSFVDISVDDYVVHVDHGIGIFKGFEKLDADGEKDHFIIQYAEGDRLYVPVGEMHLVQKYVGFEKRPPRIYRLGSSTWKKTKEKTRKSIYFMAFEMLELNAVRSGMYGFSFHKDVDWQAEFEKRFPYEETPDQARSCAEVKKDMESPGPMDRLLCGDVGYGKTEVALRAVFKAVMSNKQVVVLVPTTLLAEQHYITFRERMKDFPVNVEMLSRFRTGKEVKQVLEGTRNGTIDVVIGTHALLRKNIKFKDLGLVVIDEEQRFGVKDKEKLKKMRLLADILTLTATPIPRTLYMSLMGLKDMSIIETPPQNRLPVKVFVAEYDKELVKSAITREKTRGGQVFFVHNRVDGIEKIASGLSGLIDDSKIAVAHGRMSSRELESVMKEFMKGNIDVLVCTVIIESGIDIPNANTLIVNRADMFGLADLYQLKGRVGRFKNRAYAYFLIPKGGVINTEASRRLRAIERYRELGSGFKIAMEDLEIRGAGNLLGAEQHGYIMAVGFDLYCRMLREVVDALKRNKKEQRRG